MTTRTLSVLHWTAVVLLAVAVAAIFLGVYLVSEANAAQAVAVEGAA